MAPTTPPHPSILLLARLFSLRDGASPFTLVLDSVEQVGRPVVRRFVEAGKASKTKIIYISFETLNPPRGVDVFIRARGKSIKDLQQVIGSASQGTKSLLIIDTLHPLASSPDVNLLHFFSSLLSPQVSLFAIYHTDMALLSSSQKSPYAPAPLTMLRYLATAILIPHSLPQILAKKRAQDRSLPEPVFGLTEEKEGVLIGRGANDTSKGIVLEMEYRRKSGRGVTAMFVLPPKVGVGDIVLLTNFSEYRNATTREGDEGDEGTVVGGMESTFDLGLTEKQRRAREGVVLPYFDAQKGEMGEGGRILYDLGVEDDFDEEEDEI
ncbi:MAG: hypothetical protein Q9167_002103 [Letrouitia subvulpina]